MEKLEEPCIFDIGDYVRWPIGVAVFAASDEGEVHPIKMNYSYGIIVDIARGTGKHADVVIIYCGPKRTESWVVCHVNDEDYQLEVVGKGGNDYGK